MLELNAVIWHTLSHMTSCELTNDEVELICLSVIATCADGTHSCLQTSLTIHNTCNYMQIEN